MNRKYPKLWLSWEIDWPSKPASDIHCLYSEGMLAPLIHPTSISASFRMLSGKGCFARMSEMARRPPGLRIRKISWKTAGFSGSGTRLITQFEQTMSAMPFGSTIDVMLDLTFVPLLMDLLEYYWSNSQTRRSYSLPVQHSSAPAPACYRSYRRR